MNLLRILHRFLKVYAHRRDWFYSPSLVTIYGRYNYHADAHIYPDGIQWRGKMESLPRDIIYLPSGRVMTITAITEKQIRELEQRQEAFIKEWHARTLNQTLPNEKE